MVFLFAQSPTSHFDIPIGQVGLVRTLISQDPKLLNGQDVVSNLSFLLDCFIDSWYLNRTAGPPSTGLRPLAPSRLFATFLIRRHRLICQTILAGLHFTSLVE